MGDTLVYILAEPAKRMKSRPCPSSYDISDREYGWTDADVANATRPYEADCLDLSIRKFDGGSDTILGTRGKTLEGSTTATLFFDGKTLFDGTYFGIRNSLSDELLSRVIADSIGGVGSMGMKEGELYFSTDPTYRKLNSYAKRVGDRSFNTSTWHKLGITPRFSMGGRWVDTVGDYGLEWEKDSTTIQHPDGQITLPGKVIDAILVPDEILKKASD